MRSYLRNAICLGSLLAAMLLPALGSALYLIPFLCIRYSKAQKERVERELAERREHTQEENTLQA